MVFLRLTVKVLPRDRVLEDVGSSTAPNPISNGDKESVTAVKGAALEKVIIFQLPVRDPDSITLGALAGLIQEKWKLLRPNAGPLDIKKILDSEKPEENLTIDLTVADVFVQHGKAALDGQDQHGTVLVIQKPTTQPTFEREGSVVQDWAAAAAESSTSFRQQIQYSRRPQPSIMTIYEEEPLKNSVKESVEHDGIDVDVERGQTRSTQENQSTQNGVKNMQIDVHDHQSEAEPNKSGLGQDGPKSPPTSHNEFLPAASVNPVEREESAKPSIRDFSHVSRSQNDHPHYVPVNIVERAKSADNNHREPSPVSTLSNSEGGNVEGSPPRERQPSEELGISAPDPRPPSPLRNERRLEVVETPIKNSLRHETVVDGVQAVENEEQLPSTMDIVATQSFSEDGRPDLGDMGNGRVAASDDYIMTESFSSIDSPLEPSEEQQHRPTFETKVVRDSTAKRKPMSLNEPSQLELTTVPSTPPSRKLAPAESMNSPSGVGSVRALRIFSSPPKPLEFPEVTKNRPHGSMGLGITGSPSAPCRPSLPAYTSESGNAHSQRSCIRPALRKVDSGQLRRHSASLDDGENGSPPPSKKRRKVRASIESAAPTSTPNKVNCSSEMQKEALDMRQEKLDKKNSATLRAPKSQSTESVANQKGSGRSSGANLAKDSFKQSPPAEDLATSTFRESLERALARKQRRTTKSSKIQSTQHSARVKAPEARKSKGKDTVKNQKPPAVTESDSSSESDNVDAELFGNAPKPEAKRESIRNSQPSAWVPTNNGFPSTLDEVREARRRNWGPEYASSKAPKVAPTKDTSAGKTTFRKKNTVTSNPKKDMYEMTSSENERDQESSSEDDNGGILPNGKARGMQSLRSKVQPVKS
ncbi:conserved serine-rich protein [Talaromyces stipitatus ATCC 10500]|uniref:Conserved serine-rich protein n=1 Tax=Talaromyces stipitatus (strain ATCC 10500 / CBS 375.48 / QM 6759 / NRRL 1006) TaxID=441959 RepID=B8MIC3_TALSN|nr:conserved serine-rich protein [Talaromyces stipitatus ATCC 10500]EED14607.1 conserved serine-rich protein [Talaromyces stipitatus ATCC 10500]